VLLPLWSVSIVMPVFNDWQSMVALVQDIDRQFRGSDWLIDVVAVDDSSTIPASTDMRFTDFEAVRSARIVALRGNVGHQRVSLRAFRGWSRRALRGLSR